MGSHLMVAVVENFGILPLLSLTRTRSYGVASVSIGQRPGLIINLNGVI